MSIIVEFESEDWEVGKLILNARPYHPGRFMIRKVSDPSVETPVWSYQVKLKRKTQHVNSDFPRESDLEHLVVRLAGL